MTTDGKNMVLENIHLKTFLSCKFFWYVCTCGISLPKHYSIFYSRYKYLYSVASISRYNILQSLIDNILLKRFVQLISSMQWINQLPFFLQLNMKVTASEMFKGKKASYGESIPMPFEPHRLGIAFSYLFICVFICVLM